MGSHPDPQKRRRIVAHCTGGSIEAVILREPRYGSLASCKPRDAARAGRGWIDVTGASVTTGWVGAAHADAGPIGGGGLGASSRHRVAEPQITGAVRPFIDERMVAMQRRGSARRRELVGRACVDAGRQEATPRARVVHVSTARALLKLDVTMTQPQGFQRLFGFGSTSAIIRLHTVLGAIGLFSACGVDTDEPDVSEASSEVRVDSFLTTSCTTAVVIGLSNQIANEVSCLNPNSLTRFAAGSGITIASSAVLPFLSAGAKRDLQAVGNVSVNSAFRTVAAQYLLVEWFNRGRCGITAAAAPGRSNHESGRAVDLGNFSSRITAMANHGWSHSVPGDPVHFDHLSSADIRGRDTLAFQRLWNRNNAGDRISEDGIYGPQTEARLRRSPATGFPIGASCSAARAVVADVVAVDGPDKVAPNTQAHYVVTLTNNTESDWPATTKLMVPGGASELYDAASWTSNVEVGTIGVAIPAGTKGVIELSIAAPNVLTATPMALTLALTDGDAEVGTIDLAMTVTPDGDENLSTDGDDQSDHEGGGAGCSTGGGHAGWLAFAPALLVLRRRRR
jgi:hypothetical protein